MYDVNKYILSTETLLSGTFCVRATHTWLVFFKEYLQGCLIVVRQVQGNTSLFKRKIKIKGDNNASFLYRTFMGKFFFVHLMSFLMARLKIMGLNKVIVGWKKIIL